MDQYFDIISSSFTMYCFSFSKYQIQIYFFPFKPKLCFLFKAIMFETIKIDVKQKLLYTGRRVFKMSVLNNSDKVKLKNVLCYNYYCSKFTVQYTNMFFTSFCHSVFIYSKFDKFTSTIFFSSCHSVFVYQKTDNS